MKRDSSFTAQAISGRVLVDVGPRTPGDLRVILVQEIHLQDRLDFEVRQFIIEMQESQLF